MDARIQKLQDIEKRYLEIGDLMLIDENVSNVKTYTKLSKEQASLKGAYEAYQEYKRLNNAIEEASMMVDDDDEEIREMAALELDAAKQ